MEKKLYMICGSVALFAGACSDNNVSGTSVASPMRMPATSK